MNYGTHVTILDSIYENDYIHWAMDDPGDVIADSAPAGPVLDETVDNIRPHEGRHAVVVAHIDIR